MSRYGIFTAALVFSIANVQATAQSSDPAWLDQVREEIASAKSCDVTYFININETELGGKRLFEARVQCADGRMFDASRLDPSTTFEFRACEIQVC